jgi:hypothetical protein
MYSETEGKCKVFSIKTKRSEFEIYLRGSCNPREQRIKDRSVEVFDGGTNNKAEPRATTKTGVRCGPKSNTKTKFVWGTTRHIRDNTTEPQRGSIARVA